MDPIIKITWYDIGSLPCTILSFDKWFGGYNIIPRHFFVAGYNNKYRIWHNYHMLIHLSDWGVGKKTHDKSLLLKVSDTRIKCEDVKLLGVDIDYQLNDQHISNVCGKAGQQLNVLEIESFSIKTSTNVQFWTCSFYLILITAPLLGIFVKKVTPKTSKKFQSGHWGLFIIILNQQIVRRVL